MKLSNLAVVAFSGATALVPPQPPSRTSDAYKWRPSKPKCGTMATANSADLKHLSDVLEVKDIKWRFPPTHRYYRPLCFSPAEAGIYVYHNHDETVVIRGSQLARTIEMVRLHCCVHLGNEYYPKSGQVDYPEMGVRILVGYADCLNGNDWVDPMAIEAPNNCLFDVNVGGESSYLPGANHTDAWAKGG